jgi:hypothetical protein
MKKSQRLRFYALISKQAQGSAALTADESTELTTLTALAAVHPNAAADTDDTAPAPAPAAAATAPATTAPAATATPAAPAPVAAAQAPAPIVRGDVTKPGVSARLAAAMAGLAGGTPALAAAALQTEQQAHTATRATLTQSQADLATARASLASTETALATVCGFFGLKPEEISGKTEKETDALLAAKISAAATEKLASLGVAPGRLPAPKPGGSADSKTITSAEFAALTPAQKSDFSVKGGRIAD